MIIINSINNASIYMFLLCLYLYLTVLHSSSASKPKLAKQKQTDYCTNLEFRCENGQCIAKPFVCDGLSDCEDGSDETYNQCQNMSCNEQHFQCDYGACIKKGYQCDGLKQCFDGSDEWAQACNPNSTIETSIRSRRAPSDLCAVPEPSLDKVIIYNCEGIGLRSCDTTNGYVPEFGVASIRCMPNYYPEKKTQSESICHRKSWVPPFDNCYKMCDKLNPINVDLRCSRKGISIPCDENSLLAGSKIRPTCQQLHRYAGNIPPDYLEMTCNEDGKWDKPLFSCIPECGKPYTAPTTLINNGVAERFGDSPWHVAVYNTKKILICGGTIVNPYLIISAAHCFVEKGSLIPDPKNYEIVVSKVSRDYSIIDNDNQKVLKIKEIRLSNKGYFGLNNYFQADIAAVILDEKLTISPTVLPACIDWIGLSTSKYPAEGTLAKVSGWGLNERSKYTEKLMTLRLPFISRARCLNIVPDDFKAFITFDKFCAGTEGGPGVLQGDSGGGLLFPQMSQDGLFYYLRGIVSLKQPTSTTIAAFTDLADHIEWLSEVTKDIESRITFPSKKVQPAYSGERTCKNHEVSNCVKIRECEIAETLIASRKAIFCGYDTDYTEKICCSLRNSSQTITSSEDTSQQTVPVTSTTQENDTISTKNSTEIALSYCEKYSKYATDCIHDEPPTGERKKAQLKEYPHIARIGCGSDLNNVVWCCVGSLISETFILSVAHCSIDQKEGPKWAFMGHLNEATVKLSAQNRIYSIEKVYNHPDYIAGEKNDIALFKLKKTVVMNPYIRPACLFTSDFPQTDNKFKIASWGTSKIIGSRSSNLLKSTITVVDDKRCKSICGCYESNSMACVGKLTDGEALCLTGGGAPLQTSLGNDSCVWSIFSIMSRFNENPPSCGYLGNVKPYVNTKISYYLDWIQNIVWP